MLTRHLVATKVARHKAAIKASNTITLSMLTSSIQGILLTTTSEMPALLKAKSRARFSTNSPHRTRPTSNRGKGRTTKTIARIIPLSNRVERNDELTALLFGFRS